MNAHRLALLATFMFATVFLAFVAGALMQLMGQVSEQLNAPLNVAIAGSSVGSILGLAGVAKVSGE